MENDTLFPWADWKVDLSDQNTNFHSASVHSRWAQAQRSRRCFWSLLTYGFHCANCSLVLHLWIQWQMMFIDKQFVKVFPNPCLDTHYSMMGFNAVRDSQVARVRLLGGWCEIGVRLSNGLTETGVISSGGWIETRERLDSSGRQETEVKFSGGGIMIFKWLEWD